jgi:DNA-binding transcriptional regulator YiaG
MNSFEERLERVEVEEPITVPNADGTTRTVMVKVPALRDPEDGEIYFGTDASAILDKAKARHMGVLAPQELAELRKRLGLTQKEIAEVLQIGEKSWSRWETGREIVSRSLNLLLMALYEGRVNLPWLRAKCIHDKQPAPAPRLRSSGLALLYQQRMSWNTLTDALRASRSAANMTGMHHYSHFAIYTHTHAMPSAMVSPSQRGLAHPPLSQFSAVEVPAECEELCVA